MNAFIIFLTGLTTGGLSCMLVQGGLLASVVANQKKMVKNEAVWIPVVLFLSSKLVAHTILGFLLGAVGSTLTLSLEVRLFFQFFTAFFMFATAMNLLEVHPLFRYVSFQPPKFLQKYIRNTSRSGAFFAPIVLGLLTIFIPCGVTQAMEVAAINTGSPLQGAVTMFAFVLGTVPIFATFGLVAAQAKESWSVHFSRVAAAVLIGMAAYSVNGVLVVLNAPITFQKITAPFTYFFSSERFSDDLSAPTQDGVQKVLITVTSDGYSPRYLKVQQGVPVELTLSSVDVYSCAASFVLKEFGIKTFLNPTDTKSFTFTPTRKGKFTYACSMGMYTGILEVI